MLTATLPADNYWRINNNVLDLFLEYLDEPTARRLHGDSCQGSPSLSHADNEKDKDQNKDKNRDKDRDRDTGAHPPHTSPAFFPLGQHADVFEDQYLNFAHAVHWDGQGMNVNTNMAHDLDFYLDPGLYYSSNAANSHPDSASANPHQGIDFLEHAL